MSELSNPRPSPQHASSVWARLRESLTPTLGRLKTPLERWENEGGALYDIGEQIAPEHILLMSPRTFRVRNCELHVQPL